MKLRITPHYGISINRASIGPLFDWQEWFGGYYWLRIEIWFAIWFIGVEITNRQPEEESEAES